MMATPHALVGALLAVQFKDPAIGLPIAFFSHYIFDLVPHWDWGWHPGESISRIKDPSKKKQIFIESTIDVIVGFIICFALFLRWVDPVYLFFMIIAAQGPDWLTVPWWLFGYDKFPVNVNRKFQHIMQLHARLPWGITNQILAVLLLALVIYLVQNPSFFVEATN